MVQGPVSDIASRASLTEAAKEVARTPAAVVLLAGSVRPTRLSQSLGLTLLQLPIDAHSGLIDVWRKQVNDFAMAAGWSSLPVRVMLDRASTLPPVPSGNGRAAFTIESDPRDYRGTGGVLRDIAAAYDEDDVLLVANGAQVLMQPIGEIVEPLQRLNADVAVVNHRDGTPSGIMLVRCGALSVIPATGFIDMKEQALPRIAQKFAVRVAHFDRPTGLPTRTLANYIHALRMYHQQLNDAAAIHDPFAENLRATFAIVQEGADVHATARVHDSVVMAGAKVGPGAILVRSLVCRGAVIHHDQHVIDRMIGGGGSSGASAGEGN